MNIDLTNLEITKGTLKQLIGFSLFRVSLLGILWRTILLWLFIIFCTGMFTSSDMSPESEIFTSIALYSFFIAPIIVIGWLIFKAKTQCSRTLRSLMGDVKKFNSTIKAIDVNDQLVAAGNQGMQSYQREQAIKALGLAREDLVRALKTERIIQENQSFITSNPELFSNNLISLRALQISEQAGEFSKILGDALEVATSVQEEMNKLQSLSRA